MSVSCFKSDDQSPPIETFRGSPNTCTDPSKPGVINCSTLAFNVNLRRYNIVVTLGWGQFDRKNDGMRNEVSKFLFMMRMARNHDARLFRLPITVDNIPEWM
jgi:hypothetical protein